MIELKVHCDCGQKYKFDVEPVNGQMPFTVACPLCKADGTAKGNALLQQMTVFKMVEPPPAPASAPPPPAPSQLRINLAAPAEPPAPPPRAGITPPPVPVGAAVAAPAPVLATRPSGRPMGAPQPDREQLEVEARAKILWGEAPEEVIQFLMMRGFTNEEASGKIRTMMNERRRTIRVRGIWKTIGGILISFSSAGVFLTFVKFGFISPFVMGGIGLACVFGLWMVFNGLWKFIAPGAQIGDASEND